MTAVNYFKKSESNYLIRVNSLDMYLLSTKTKPYTILKELLFMIFLTKISTHQKLNVIIFHYFYKSLQTIDNKGI